MVNKIFLFLITSILLLACQPRVERNWGQISKSGTLKVLSINSETTIYENRDGRWSGFEHDLVHAFAKKHDLSVDFILKDSVDELFYALDNGKGDLIAAGIAITEARKKQYGFGPSYAEIQQQVICQKGVSPQNIEDLESIELVVGLGTSYLERLQEIRKTHPDLSWDIAALNTPEMIQLVAQKKAGCTVADSNMVQVYRRYFPDLNVSFSLGEPQELAWVTKDGQKKTTRET